MQLAHKFMGFSAKPHSLLSHWTLLMNCYNTNIPGIDLSITMSTNRMKKVTKKDKNEVTGYGNNAIWVMTPTEVLRLFYVCHLSFLGNFLIESRANFFIDHLSSIPQLRQKIIIKYSCKWFFFMNQWMRVFASNTLWEIDGIMGTYLQGWENVYSVLQG